MGALAAVYSEADGLKRRLRDLFAQPDAYAEQVAGQIRDTMRDRPAEAVLEQWGPGAGTKALAGILRYTPWEKASTRLPDLQEFGGKMKAQFERLLRKTEQTGVEHGSTGVRTPTKLDSALSRGDQDSLDFTMPRAWYSGNRVRQTPAMYQFHTHPGFAEETAPFFSLADMVATTRLRQFAPNPRGMYLPTESVRGNMEQIVSTPNKEYAWLTFKRAVPPGQFLDPKLLSRPPTDYDAATDTLARLIYGAKKDRWDLQLGFDPRNYGVSP